MGWLKKLQNNRGQYILEYTTLILLVTAGTIIMYPYVIRSWNAYIKGYDNAAEDSINDPLLDDKDAKPSTKCECEWVKPGQCALNAPDEPCCGCGGDFNMTGLVLKCKPQGCITAELASKGLHDRSSDCSPDPRCCTDPKKTNYPEGCGTNSTERPKNYPDECKTLCGYGEICRTWMCGDEPQSDCVADENCENRCIGPYPTAVQYGALCPEDETNLERSLPRTYVAAGECTSVKCEGQCADSFVPSADGFSCECPEGSQIFEGKCISCTKSAKWINIDGRDYGSCSQACSALGLVSTPNAQGFHCASGETRPNSGEGWNKINYTYGCNSCEPHADIRKTYDFNIYDTMTCYKSNQTVDYNTKDVTVACFCENIINEDFCCPKKELGCDFDGTRTYKDEGENNNFGISCQNYKITGFCGDAPYVFCKNKGCDGTHVSPKFIENEYLCGAEKGLKCDFEGTWSYSDRGASNDFAITCRNNTITGFCGETPTTRGFHPEKYLCEGPNPIYCNFDGTWSYGDAWDEKNFAVSCRNNTITGWCSDSSLDRGFHFGRYDCEIPMCLNTFGCPQGYYRPI